MSRAMSTEAKWVKRQISNDYNLQETYILVELKQIVEPGQRNGGTERIWKGGGDEEKQKRWLYATEFKKKI